MKLRTEISRLLLAGGSVLALVPTAAFAQESGLELEEVIVTASKRAESIQEIPFAVSALTGDAMECKGLANLGDVSNFVPSL